MALGIIYSQVEWMKRNIYINAAGSLTRIALVEDNQTVELYLESEQRNRLQGNVYLGTVTRVLPGMQAAFVDIGLPKDAFLYIQDASLAGETLTPPFNEDEEEPTLSDTEEAIATYAKVSIEEIVQPGQKIIVQISREPQTMKGARITSHITLPGRYLVLMPTVNHVGVSKRIESETERERLKGVIESLNQFNYGFIVRTVAENRDELDFEPDIRYLSELWQGIQVNARRAKPPALLHQDLDPISRVLRDLFADSIDEVMIDSQKEFERCRDFVSSFAPQLADRIRFYDEPVPLFYKYRIENEIEKGMQRKVWLPSGGYLIFDQAEALVAIDVNTGRYVGKGDFEATVVQTNMEAAELIGHQVRLRDLSGIIVIDFIDMQTTEHQAMVVEALRKAFSRDRAQTNISDFTSLGLVEMTRKRLKRSLLSTLMQPCPYCQGAGHVKHPQTVAYQLCCELENLVSSIKFKRLAITINPAIKPFLNDHFEAIRSKVKSQGKDISINLDKEMHLENFDILKT
jgi:ribonuclease G